MTAISAASVRCSTLMDGTLRVVFDVEPSEAGAAFALFGKPGTPAALAALAVGYAAVQESAVSTKHERSEIVDKPKGGPLAREAAELCRNQAFLRWMDEEQHMNGDANEETAAEWIRQECRVKSRAELDLRDDAGAWFITNVRIPFFLWRRLWATA
jgi:hypothetical protein